MDNIKDLFQRVCNGETLDENQQEMLRREFVFDTPLSAVVIGEDKMADDIKKKLACVPIQDIRIWHDNFDTLESMHPDIIFLDTKYFITFLKIHESKVLKDAILVTIGPSKIFIEVAYAYDIDMIIMSKTFCKIELNRKLTDMLVYKKCCELKGTAFDYCNCLMIYPGDKKSNTILVRILLQHVLGINIVEYSDNNITEIMHYLREEQQPTVVFLETDEKQIDGIKIMSKIHKFENYRYVPFIFFLVQDDNIINGAFTVGASEIIIKPYFKYEIIYKIRYQLRMQQCMRIYRRIMGIE